MKRCWVRIIRMLQLHWEISLRATRSANQNEKSIALLERSLKIMQKIYGAEHPSVATALDNLACYYADQKQFEKAENLELQALAIYEKTLRPDHPDLAITLDNLCEVYQNLGREQDGRRLRRTFFNHRLEDAGTGSPIHG